MQEELVRVVIAVVTLPHGVAYHAGGERYILDGPPEPPACRGALPRVPACCRAGGASPLRLSHVGKDTGHAAGLLAVYTRLRTDYPDWQGFPSAQSDTIATVLDPPLAPG